MKNPLKSKDPSFDALPTYGHQWWLAPLSTCNFISSFTTWRKGLCSTHMLTKLTVFNGGFAVGVMRSTCPHTKFLFDADGKPLLSDEVIWHVEGDTCYLTPGY